MTWLIVTGVWGIVFALLMVERQLERSARAIEAANSNIGARLAEIRQDMRIDPIDVHEQRLRREEDAMGALPPDWLVKITNSVANMDQS